MAPDAQRHTRPLWRCPRCGNRFVTRNLWHSCGHHRLADHFAGKPADIDRRLAALVREAYGTAAAARR